MTGKLQVHQFLPTLGYRDAVGNHSIVLREALAERGVTGEIWPQIILPEMNDYAAGPYPDYARRRRERSVREVLLYQTSTGSNELMNFLMGRPEPKFLWYHNITPPGYFHAFDPGAAMSMARGREELKVLAPQVAGAVADSEFNARDLRKLGIPAIRVVPPYLPPGLDAQPHPDLASWLRRTKTGTDLLFVGRIAPNKGHVHLLKLLAALRAAVDPGARLFVVGSWGPERYMELLFHVRDRLGLEGVVFPGSVSSERLAAYYQESDMLVCLSEHEGYGLPLVEAMRARLPVVAYDAGAVGETLGGAGVLVRTLDPQILAEVVGRVASDLELREQIVRGQEERLVEIERAPRCDVLLELVRTVLER